MTIQRDGLPDDFEIDKFDQKCDGCGSVGDVREMGRCRRWNSTRTVCIESYTCTDCDEAEKETEGDRYAKLENV